MQENNFFLQDGQLAEAGIIAHMAQTAAALAGYGNIEYHTAPKVGFIGEVKDFQCSALPRLGDTLTTSLVTIAEMAGVTLVECHTKCNEEPIAQCQLKIVIQD